MTQLLESGVHPKVASAVLGHASEAFTQRQYQHLLDGMTDAAAEAINDALSPEAFANGLHREASR